MSGSTRKKIGAKKGCKWQCDFCHEAAFDTFGEALEHERHCEAKTAEITLNHQQGRILGLSFRNKLRWKDMCGSPEQEVAIFESSTVIKYSDAICEAASAIFFRGDIASYQGWTCRMRRDTYIDSVMAFGRKNLTGINLDTINDKSLRAALTGLMRAGDTITKVDFKNGSNRKEFTNITEEKDVTDLIRKPYRFPVKLTLQHKDYTKPEKQDSGDKPENPFSMANKLDLSDGILQLNKNWGHLMSGLSQLHLLENLDLSKNHIGRDGCEALATLLEKENSVLKCLSLTKTRIDNECISVIVNALRNNKTLEKLNLSKNKRITESGWKCILDLICDSTSINSTYLSNHTLQGLGVDLLRLAQSTNSSELQTVLCRLTRMLSNNEFCSAFAARRKIWDTHFDECTFDLQPFLDMDVKIMPHLISWMTRNIVRSCSNIYYFIKNWDVPVLFGFPSAESERIGSRITELESLVKKLRLKNTELREENQALKAGDGSNLKRRRKS